MKVTFLGHSTVQIESGEHSIIIDPFLTHNPAAGAKAEDIKAQYVLLTHGHGDHVSDVVTIAKNNDATVVGTFELASYFEWQGLKVHKMNTGGGYNFDFGRLKLTQAFHSSGLVLDNEQRIIYMGMPNGLIIQIDGKTIYHAGDTCLFSDMKLIGEFHDIDLALLPIGDNFTMGPEEAAIAAEWVKAKQVIPIHYDTFGVIKQDGEAFVERLKQKGITGHALKPGESLTL